MATLWALRPVSSAAHDAAHTGVVWKLVKVSPCCATRSKVGVCAGPPNTLMWPYPMSSPMTSNTFGAPTGALNGSG